MTVMMNPPSARSRLHSGSMKLSNSGAQDHEDIERKLSDDVYSLNSWSENLSTSSSSESGSRHGSVSRHGDQRRDVRSKVKASVGKVFRAGQMRVTKSPSSGKTASKFPSRTFESSIPLVPCSNYDDYQYEASIHDPDFSFIHNYDNFDTVDGSHFQVSNHNFAKSDETVSDNMSTPQCVCSPVTSVPDPRPQPSQTHISDPSRLGAQRLYPDLEALKCLDRQGDVQTLTPPSLPSVTASSRDLKSGQPQRWSYFDFSKLSNQHSRNPQMHSGSGPHSEPPHKQVSSTSSKYILSHGSDAADQIFNKHTTNVPRIDRSSHQGTVTLAGRLHRSQPVIPTAPHLTRLPKSANDLESLRLSFEHRLEAENVKTRVKSVWNNIKYGWTFKSKPSFKCDSPLYILGRCYHRQKDDPSSEVEDQFLRDFVSRIWLTYRSNFYPIPGTKLSTDCGWGCMLRSGQMLVAQCLVTHFLGRDWRLYNKQSEAESAYYREIIRWFSDPIDTPSDKTPFCLHHLANFGRAYNKDPGEWYGPSSVAYIFRDAFTKASQAVPVLSQLCVYVAQDCTVYIKDVVKMCTERRRSESASGASVSELGSVSFSEGDLDGKWQRSLIILIPIRLGGELMNEIYIPCVQNLLSQQNCMGIIGGKPKHSLYFIGWQEEKLIYLDPHLCREAVDTSVSDFRIETYHCMTPRKLAINKMDPSCTVGFYIQDAEDFKKFVREVTEFVSPPSQKGVYPLFIFADGHLCESPAKQNHPASDRRVKVTHYRVDQNGQRHRTFSRESEEFVVL